MKDYVTLVALALSCFHYNEALSLQTEMNNLRHQGLLDEREIKSLESLSERITKSRLLIQSDFEREEQRNERNNS
jgi:hypothetical protein